jgi:hypothetical protein
MGTPTTFRGWLAALAKAIAVAGAVLAAIRSVTDGGGVELE